jgi:hypothetical protein
VIAQGPRSVRLTHHANVARPRLAPGQWRGRGGPVARDGDLRTVDRAADPHVWSAMALMAERIFLIVFGIVVPIAVMVALVHMN